MPAKKYYLTKSEMGHDCIGPNLRLAREFHALKPPSRPPASMAELANKHAKKKRIDPRYLGRVRLAGEVGGGG